MVLNLITNARVARACFDALVSTCAETASSIAEHRAGFRTGGVTATTYFFRRHGIWAMPTDGSMLSRPNRYWNCFGLGRDAESASSNIAVEINHPHSGKSQVSGRFLTDDGRFLIGHTGRIGGGVKGFSGTALERIVGYCPVVVEVDGRPETLAFLGPLYPAETFIETLAAFVRLMAAARKRIKAASA